MKTRDRQRAFTLLELLLALAIFSLMVAGMVTWLASLEEVWRPEKRIGLDEHAWAATRRLERWLRAGQQAGRLQPGRWDDHQGYQTASLVIEGTRDLFGRPIGTGVSARAAVVRLPRLGLVVVNLDGGGNNAPLAVSPWVEEMWFDYEGAPGQPWEAKQGMQAHADRLPRRVRLVFRREGEELSTSIHLAPAAPKAAS